MLQTPEPASTQINLMSTALAIQCRGPGEFIASVVERHRGLPLPKSDDEKTYLVFIGMEGEDELLQQIPGECVEFVAISGRNLEGCGRHGGKESVRYPVHEQEGHQDVEIPLRPHEIRRFPCRMNNHVPLDEGMDEACGRRGGFYDYSLEGEAGSEIYEAVQGLSPNPQVQQVRNGGIGSVGKRRINNTREHTTPEEAQEVGEVTDKELVEWNSPLPLNLLKGLDLIGDDEQTINKNHESEKFTVRERAIFRAASEEFRQPTEVPMIALQVKTGSSILVEVLPSNRCLSFESETAGNSGGPARKKDGSNVEKKESNKSTSDSGRQGTILGGREVSGEFEDKEQKSQTTNKISSKALTLGHHSTLPVREPGSTSHPQHDEISILTKHFYSSSNHNTGVEIPIGLEGEAENPPYPAKIIQNLISIEHVDIVYLEDLETLHGLLEAMMLSPVSPMPNPPLLAIWGLVGAHHQTKYFGGGGIGETVARAVETAAKSGRFLVLGEGYIEGDYEGGEDEKSWVDIEVPVFNTGNDITESTVIVRDILRRWCRFGEDLDDFQKEEGKDETNENVVIGV